VEIPRQTIIAWKKRSLACIKIRPAHLGTRPPVSDGELGRPVIQEQAPKRPETTGRRSERPEDRDECEPDTIFATTPPPAMLGEC